MKSIKNIALTSVLALASFGVVTLSSCSKDEEVTCEAGYEKSGSDCVELRAELIGSFDAVDVRTSDALTKTYVAVVAKNTSVSVVNISGFGDFFTGTEIVTSNVTKSGNVISFSIPSQKPDGENTVNGSGTYDISSKKAAVTYTITSSSNDIVNYTGTWTKKN